MPGDISVTWPGATDDPGDGVADHVGLYASPGKYGSELTGFKVDRRNPFSWVVAFQHPSSGNDALWSISHDVTRSCDSQSAGNRGQFVSCIARAARSRGIKGEKQDALMDIANDSSCGR